MAVTPVDPSNPPGFLIQQGLSDKAADASTQAQLNSINSAKDNYTKSNQSAIDSLMSGYGSAFNLQSPQIQSGGYANAKLNYMLGLPSMSGPTAVSRTPDMSDQEWQNKQDQYNTQKSISDYSQGLGQASAGDIQGIVSNLPGWQAMQNQGINSIENAASAKGMLKGGNILSELQKFGMGMQSDFYNNFIGQLSGQAAVGNNASNNVANQVIGLGQGVAGLRSDLGANMANADIATGQVQSQGVLSKMSSYNNRYVPTIDPAYTQAQQYQKYQKAQQDNMVAKQQAGAGNTWYNAQANSAPPSLQSFGLPSNYKPQ